MSFNQWVPCLLEAGLESRAARGLSTAAVLVSRTGFCCVPGST